MNREEMISWLVANDRDYIDAGYGSEWLSDILIYGFEGYDKQPDDVLRREILERDEDALNEEDAA